MTLPQEVTRVFAAIDDLCWVQTEYISNTSRTGQLDFSDQDIVRDKKQKFQRHLQVFIGYNHSLRGPKTVKPAVLFYKRMVSVEQGTTEPTIVQLESLSNASNYRNQISPL